MLSSEIQSQYLTCFIWTIIKTGDYLIISYVGPIRIVFSFYFFIFLINLTSIIRIHAAPSNAAEVKTCSKVKAEWLQTAAGTEDTREPIFKQAYRDTFHHRPVGMNLRPGQTDLYMHVWVCFESISDVFNSLSLCCFSFSSLSLCPLPGIDFKVKTIDVDGKKVKLQVW